MKRHIITYLLACIIFQNITFANSGRNSDTISDTIKILVRDISSNELSGASDRKIVRGFSIISGKDTSKFLCILTELKTGQVFMDLQWSKGKTFRDQFAELKKLLPEAKKEFNLDSLRYIDAGLLSEMGNLDLQVTQEFLDAALNNNSIIQNKAAKYLMKTQVAREFNTLLKPYNLTIAAFEPEHVYFTEKKFLFDPIFSRCKVTIPIEKIPDQIFDCDVSIRLKKL